MDLKLNRLKHERNLLHRVVERPEVTLAYITGRNRDQIALLLEDLEELEMQEPDKQSRFKLSYYTPEEIDQRKLKKKDGVNDSKRKILGQFLSEVLTKPSTGGSWTSYPKEATKYHACSFHHAAKTAAWMK